ncbi:MAG: NADPH-dependent FMN reductase [Candidatus Micrarchaeaceae archaeon]
MDKKIKIFGFGGSFRKGSYTKALLHAADELVPESAELEIFDIERIPLFNQDLEKNMPEEVRRFKDGIKAADAVLISTPEYNYSVPGFLKNAIDWASRPYGDNSFEDKPVALMSGSGGTFGGSRAQYHLRQMMVFLNAHVINKPEVIVTFMNEKISNEGIVTDEKTREKIREMLEALVSWAKRLGHK